MSLSEQTARVAGGGKNTLKTILQNLGVSVGSQTIDQYPTLANQISNKLLPNNLISAATASSLGLAGTATPNEAFAKIKALIDAANSNANGRLRIEKIVRTGTGTYEEANAPSVTFSFPPKFVFLAEFFGRNGNSVSHAVAMDLIGTTATPDFGFCENTGNDYYAKKSSDGKTLYWWGEALWTIYNDIGKTYVLYGVG